MVDELRHIGTVTTVNPSRRELRVAIVPGRAAEFEAMEWVSLVLAGGESMRCRVAGAGRAGDIAKVRLSEGVTRDNVARMKGAKVVVTSDLERVERRELSTGEVVGFAVVSADGSPVGEIVGELETKAHVIFEIERVGGGSLLVPAIEEVILGIDWTGRSVVVVDLAPYAVESDTSEGTRLA